MDAKAKTRRDLIYSRPSSTLLDFDVSKTKIYCDQWHRYRTLKQCEECTATCLNSDELCRLKKQLRLEA